MSVNGITSANSSYTTPQTTAKTKVSQTTNTADAKDIGVVYETSSKTDDKSNKIKDYSSVVATMKKELSTKNEQLQNLVTKLLGKQAGKYTKLADLFKDIQADGTAKKKKVLVLGSGPIRIGQGIEFDFCSVHCTWAFSKAGYETIIINNNPETVSTDFDIADKLYFEPLTPEDVENVVNIEKPDGAVA